MGKTLLTEDPCKALECSDESKPTLCVVSGYDNHTFIPEFSLRAWGTNPCQARSHLLKILCEKKMQPEKIEGLSCVPDPSGMECPAPASTCPAGEKTKVHCRASRYAGQRLRPGTFVYALGGSECEAMASLKTVACNLHLRPSALGGINCEADKSKGECPLQQETCAKAYKPYLCEAKLRDANKKITTISAFGLNKCLAKAALDSQACALNQRPSELAAVACVAEN